MHWFGLTDGWYRIELAGHQLLPYSSETLQRYRIDHPAVQRPFAGYYAARLWEDTNKMTPAVLQPVPVDLLDFVASDPDAWRPMNSERFSS
ncbi:DUF5984 family protein [Microbispora sp. H10836]|uniref:DUF5984 family protein n=1 Tax=Microbispora sp. H10836 TaxID=2729106 RepID=UPI0037CCC258